jgi:hypothetical protein
VSRSYFYIFKRNADPPQVARAVVTMAEPNRPPFCDLELRLPNGKVVRTYHGPVEAASQQLVPPGEKLHIPLAT